MISWTEYFRFCQLGAVYLLMFTTSYHMQYAHGICHQLFCNLTPIFLILRFLGISPNTALTFSPPIEFRTAQRTVQGNKNEKDELEEGKCHHCQAWVPVEGIKKVEAKVSQPFLAFYAVNLIVPLPEPAQRNILVLLLRYIPAISGINVLPSFCAQVETRRCMSQGLHYLWRIQHIYRR